METAERLRVLAMAATDASLALSKIAASDGCQPGHVAYLSKSAMSAIADRAQLGLDSAILRGADLSDEVLSGEVLSGEVLRHIKANFWMILTMARAEVPALIAALREGRVNGSTYHGECACLCGSLENAGSGPLPHNANSPAESWFMPIREGDKPDSESEGGFRSKLAIEWALEFCAFNGINPDKTPKSASKRKVTQ